MGQGLRLLLLMTEAVMLPPLQWFWQVLARRRPFGLESSRA
jgi:hypothetical protein